MDIDLTEAQLGATVQQERIATLEAENKKLRSFLESSRSVDQATGAVSIQYGVPPSEAFELLRAMAKSQRRNFREYAEEVLVNRGRFPPPPVA
jgi:AmiR/NasT family two-component response regulator